MVSASAVMDVSLSTTGSTVLNTMSGQLTEERVILKLSEDKKKKTTTQQLQPTVIKAAFCSASDVCCSLTKVSLPTLRAVREQTYVFSTLIQVLYVQHTFLHT